MWISKKRKKVSEKDQCDCKSTSNKLLGNVLSLKMYTRLGKLCCNCYTSNKLFIGTDAKSSYAYITTGFHLLMLYKSCII